MSQKTMNWQAVSKALDITTETCTVYRAPPRTYTQQKRRLTKDTAIKDAVTLLAQTMSPCACSPGDSVTPSDYCGCNERHMEMVEVLTDVVKRLPASAEEWAKVTTDEYWEDYKWKEEV